MSIKWYLLSSPAAARVFTSDVYEVAPCCEVKALEMFDVEHNSREWLWSYLWPDAVEVWKGTRKPILQVDIVPAK